MIVVRVELHSAITHRVTEIARMEICNVGGDGRRGDYEGRTFRGRRKSSLDERQVTRTGEIKNYPRLDIHVWHLVQSMLTAMGYTKFKVVAPMVEVPDADLFDPLKDVA